jgi:hypothetical protein
VQPMRRVAVAAAAAIAAVVLFLLLRPSSDGGEAAPSSTAPTSSSSATATATATTTATTATTATPRKRPRSATVRITIRDGRVLGGIKHPRVQKGELVTLVIRADVSDEVHLHGYDVSRAVTPGHVVRVAFHATVAGRFEIELEERGLEIAELEVER